MRLSRRNTMTLLGASACFALAALWPLRQPGSGRQRILRKARLSATYMIAAACPGRHWMT
jgi:hypothetical protein